MLILLEINNNAKNKEIYDYQKEISILKRSKLVISKRNIDPAKKQTIDS